MTLDTYQNQDIDNLNPLQTKEDAAIAKKNLRLFGLTLPEDPKVKLLLILSSIVVLLLIISLFTTLSRRTPKPPSRTVPTPTPNVTPLPTEVADTTNIPADIKDKFKEIDININTTVDFNPPQIDTEVGL